MTIRCCECRIEVGKHRSHLKDDQTGRRWCSGQCLARTIAKEVQS